MTDARNMRKLIESVNGIAEQDLLREYSEDESAAEELEEISEHMLELLHTAKNIVSGTSQSNEAESYWIPHIEMAVTNDHSYLGGSMTTMQDTIEALRNGDEDEDDDEDYVGGVR